jgi:glycosyltransferase involved in cell wall biosynthesis
VILHVTPHLPPDQAANALLPAHLGAWAVDAGVEVAYLAHPPRAGSPAPVAGPVVWSKPSQGGGLLKALRFTSLAASRRIALEAEPLLRRATLVHLHSNGLLAEVVARLARRRGLPTVLTLYGTEIWHYRPKRIVDMFTAMYRGASAVTFYSRGLHDKAIELGLSRPRLSVAYPPVVERFAPVDDAARTAIRQRLGLSRRHVIVNVKRLHPLAGQTHLLAAMPAVLRAQPDTELVICGTGALRGELEAQAQQLGVAAQVRFAGLVDNEIVADYNRAADVFVLPSLLEALPTVAVEALACGTPVVSADHPGGVELHGLFGEDVVVVPREDSGRLAAALIDRLAAPRRTLAATEAGLTRHFRPAAVRAQYFALYAELAPELAQRLARMTSSTGVIGASSS